MKLNNERIFLSDGGFLKNFGDYVRGKGFNVETLFFSIPRVLLEDLEANIKEFKKDVCSLGIKKIIMHGPFYDLNQASKDKDIANLTDARYKKAIEIARQMGIDRIVLHTQFNPQLKIPAYVNNWKKSSLNYFIGLMEFLKDDNITILIENMFDDDPGIMRELVENVNSPRFRLCLDIGHINVYSQLSIAQWIKQLSPYIVYFHLSDNDGTADYHRALGSGNIDFKKFFKVVESEGIDADFCIEMLNEESHRISMKYLRNL